MSPLRKWVGAGSPPAPGGAAKPGDPVRPVPPTPPVGAMDQFQGWVSSSLTNIQQRLASVEHHFPLEAWTHFPKWEDMQTPPFTPVLFASSNLGITPPFDYTLPTSDLPITWGTWFADTDWVEVTSSDTIILKKDGLYFVIVTAQVRTDYSASYAEDRLDNWHVEIRNDGGSVINNLEIYDHNLYLYSTYAAVTPYASLTVSGVIKSVAGDRLFKVVAKKLSDNLILKILNAGTNLTVMRPIR